MATIPWKQIVVTALITGTVAIGTGMMLFRLQQRQPRLEFFAEATIPFQGQDETLAIYQVTIRNNGRGAVRQVSAYINVTPGQVRQARVKVQPGLEVREKSSAEAYAVEVASLNPGESVVASVLAGGNVALPAEPSVSLRGEGVSGARANRTTGVVGSLRGTLGSALAAAYAGLATVFFLRRGPLRGVLASGGNQREDLAFLCGLHGLTDEMARHADAASTTSYWLEAERLTALSLSNPRSAESDARMAVLTDLLRYADIAPRSKAVIHYNLARFAHARGDHDAADAALREAIRLDKSIVRRRAGVDRGIQARVKALSS